MVVLADAPSSFVIPVLVAYGVLDGVSGWSHFFLEMYLQNMG